MSEQPLLSVQHLRVYLPTQDNWVRAVDDISFTLQKGEILALVGESGCGKTMTSLGLTRLLPLGAEILAGSEIWLNQKPLHELSEKSLQAIRAKEIGMIFQDPMSSLNPVLTIEDQISESIKMAAKQPIGKRAIQEEALFLLKQVRIPDPESILKAYPHQLSGGMKQRVVIAIALAKKPSLLIADEPTTALDVTTQAQVLHLIQSLNQQYQMAILLITHDLGVVAQMADRIAVMYAGHFIETAEADKFFKDPKHPYSKKLLESLPERGIKGKPLAVIPGQVPQLDHAFPLCRFKSRCALQFKACEKTPPNLITIETQQDTSQTVRCHWYDTNVLKAYPKALQLKPLLEVEQAGSVESHASDISTEGPPLLKVEQFKVHYPIKKGIFKRTVGYIRAVDGVTFSIPEGETLALVGESGCGKTSTGKAILRLIEAEGVLELDEIPLLKLKGRKLRKRRVDFQMIFQDPFASMDPKMRIYDLLEEGMKALNIGSSKEERQERIDNALEQVGLSPSMKWRYPFEFSGGQRQRIAIARALSVGPKLIICDEPTSALDVSIQAQILNLLKSLQAEYDLSYLFITHNINVVRYMADHIAVMYLGRIVESGPAEEVLAHPKHPYTQALLESVPVIEHHQKPFTPPKGEVPSLINPPPGCHFAPRCPFRMPRCTQQYPQDYLIEGNHLAKCYLYDLNKK